MYTFRRGRTKSTGGAVTSGLNERAFNGTSNEELGLTSPAETAMLSSKAVEILEFLRWYARERLDSRRMDERRSIDLGVVPDFASVGLLGLQVPRQYQGQELSYRDTFRIMEQLGAIDCNLFVMTAVQNAVGIPPIMQHASESVKADILPLLAQGKSLTTSAASEPGMGSNLRGMTTRATRNQDGSYTINGTKRWISLGAASRYLNVFTRLYDEHGKPLGYTGFVVDTTTPGFTAGPEVLTLGLKAVPQNTLTFKDMRVPADWRLGAEDEGINAANAAFMLARLVLAAGSIGAMKRSLEVAARYATRRTVATGLLVDNGRTQQILTDAVAATQAVETLLDHITSQLDMGVQPPELLYFVAKIVATEEMFTVVDRSLQTLGARGFLDTNILGPFFRDYRLFRIFEGATEAITVYVGKMIHRNPASFAEIVHALPASPQVTNLIDEAASFTTRHAATKQEEQHILHNVLGDLLCWSVLAALTSSTATRSPMHEYTAQWCEHKLRQRLREARRDVGLELPTRSSLLSHIAGYEKTIGEIDQRRPDEEHWVDPLLVR
ncbi:acyl-CoA/acyl-ACP dehydrogenase [Saccharopolyspora sp. K220]|uniref:acyl-CoA dehydrogenase family protein n=1 Tax=Saccharopolyspora soli TaxID=2926618 RepID=UPI001F5684BC|nr:acyl-CoA dehydrogenase family protein [Saccharopolyspora soli]MCI2416639.1 acyl-CoA/acyl-ACP dehydrogenase [Saccharopolyspora soli]